MLPQIPALTPVVSPPDPTTETGATCGTNSQAAAGFQPASQAKGKQGSAA